MWLKMKNRCVGVACALLLSLLAACSISYKFNGASIDYTKIKTIAISDFTNQAPQVNPLLAPQFTESLKDGYDLTPTAVKEDAMSSQTRLTITVRVRYTNNVNPEEDFEQSFSAYREYDDTQMFQQVESELCDQISEEIIDQIYNATVANW